MNDPFDTKKDKRDQPKSSPEEISLAWHPSPGQKLQGKQADDNEKDSLYDTDSLDGEIRDQSGTIKFRAPEARRRNWGKILFRFLVFLFLNLAILGGIAFSLRFNRKFRVSFVTLCLKGASLADQQGLPNDISRNLKKLALSVVKLAPKKLKQLNPADGLTGCAAIIQTHLEKKLRSNLNPQEFYALGGCLLATDRLSIAKEYIHNDLSLPNLGVSLDPKIIAPLIMSIETARRLSPYEIREYHFAQSCLTWKVDPGCFLRMYEEARQPTKLDTEHGVSVFEKIVNKESPQIIAWYYFASGLVAMKDGQYSRAEVKLSKASVVARTLNDRFLIREIFKSRVKSLWYSGQNLNSEQIWSQMPSDLIVEDPGVFLDLEFIRNAYNPRADIQNLIAVFLDRSESYLRFNEDLKFVQWVAYMGLKNNEFSRVAAYLKNLANQNLISSKESTPDSWLNILLLRALIPLGDRKQIDPMVQSIENHRSNNPELLHLLGIVKLKRKGDPLALTSAIKYFHTSIQKTGASYSRFAEFVAYLEDRNLKAAEVILKEWRAFDRNGGGEIWLPFAEGLLSYSYGQNQKALQTWIELGQKYKNIQFIHILNNNLRDDPEYMQGRILEVLIQILPAESPLGALALSSQKS